MSLLARPPPFRSTRRFPVQLGLCLCATLSACRRQSSHVSCLAFALLRFAFVLLFFRLLPIDVYATTPPLCRRSAPHTGYTLTLLGHFVALSLELIHSFCRHRHLKTQSWENFISNFHVYLNDFAFCHLTHSLTYLPYYPHARTQKHRFIFTQGTFILKKANC